VSNKNILKYSFLINQYALREMGLIGSLDIIDLALFDICKDMFASQKTNKKISNGIQFTWIAYGSINDRAPILHLHDKDNIAKRFKKMVSCGILRSIVDRKDGNKTYFSPGEKYDDLIYFKDPSGFKTDTLPAFEPEPLPAFEPDKSPNHSYSPNQESMAPPGFEKPSDETDNHKESIPLVPSSPKKDIPIARPPSHQSDPPSRLYEWFYERLKARGSLPVDAKGKIVLHKHGRASATAIEAQVGYETAVKVYEWGFKEWYRAPDLSSWSSLKGAYDQAKKKKPSYERSLY